MEGDISDCSGRLKAVQAIIQSKNFHENKPHALLLVTQAHIYKGAIWKIIYFINISYKEANKS